MKTFCLGDIHGAYQALLECLKLSKFDKTQDRLICLGDICDRGPLVKECINELLTIPNCIHILGNHDDWALHWMQTGEIIDDWWVQGGKDTFESYEKTGVPREHIEFLTKSRLYFIDRNRLFVHGGFDPELAPEETPKETFIWDRTVIRQAYEFGQKGVAHQFGIFDEVFCGHTPTQKFAKDEPVHFCNIWDLDTGAGHGAKLTIMDIDTKQFWQSRA